MDRPPGHNKRVAVTRAGASKAWFSYVGKIPDNRGFYFLPTIPDFADISDIRQRSVPDFREKMRLFVIGRLAPSNLGDWQ